MITLNEKQQEFVNACTKMFPKKDTLDNARLSGRNNCDMIKAFVDNPYTQPLNSIR